MKKELGEFTGKTVEEATAAALSALNKKAEEVEIEVLEKGKPGGFLGIGAVKAKVCVYEPEKEESKVVKEEEKEPEVLVSSVSGTEEGEGHPTDGERAVEFLNGLFGLLNLKATSRLRKEAEKIEIEVTAEKTFDVIGKRGIILDSIQNLVGAVANIGRDEYKRVVVDCADYREKRDETLAHVARKTAEKALRQGRKVSLEPMTAYERRIIHATLADSTEVKTMSEGKEPRRYVVVIPNEIRPYTPRDRRNGNGRPQGGRNNRDFNRDRGGFNREKREGGYNNRPRRTYTEEEKRERSKMSGGTGMGSSSYKKNNTVVFGSYLGNSRNFEKKEENKDEE